MLDQAHQRTSGAYVHIQSTWSWIVDVRRGDFNPSVGFRFSRSYKRDLRVIATIARCVTEGLSMRQDLRLFRSNEFPWRNVLRWRGWFEWNVANGGQEHRRGERVIEIVASQSFTSVGDFTVGADACRLRIGNVGEDDHFRCFGYRLIVDDRTGVIRGAASTSTAEPFGVLPYKQRTLAKRATFSCTDLFDFLCQLRLSWSVLSARLD